MAPSRSPKQARTMAAVGVPRKVAAEFNRADAGTGIIRPKGKPAAKGAGRGLLGK